MSPRSLFKRKGPKLSPEAESQAKLDSGLMREVARGHADQVQKLLALGANPNASDFHGYPALWMALKLNRLDVADHLADAGADINAQFDTLNADFAPAPLLIALASWPSAPKPLESLLWLLKRGPELDCVCSRGRTALATLPGSGSPTLLERALPLARALLEAGADPNAGKIAPLMTVASGGPEAAALCALLLEFGADPDLPGRPPHNITPFEMASMSESHAQMGMMRAARERRAVEQALNTEGSPTESPAGPRL